MTNVNQQSNGVPAWQVAIRDRCYHPTGLFTPFAIEDVETSISDRFERMVELHGNRLAVKSTTRNLTYDELNRSANRIAHEIQKRWSNDTEPIAVMLEDGVSQVIASLGVLKTGKTCVPLAPSLPQERLRFSLNDSTAKIIITDGNNMALALRQGEREVINIDDIDPQLSCENLGLGIPADTLSQIYYTSGSTGRPKGIVQSHRSMLHDVMIFSNTMHVSPEDRITSVSFNLALWQIFRALLNGAAFVVVDAVEQGLMNLSKWLILEEITIYISVPTAYRHLMTSMNGDESFDNLRLIYLTGESVFKNAILSVISASMSSGGRRIAGLAGSFVLVMLVFGPGVVVLRALNESSSSQHEISPRM